LWSPLTYGQIYFLAVAILAVLIAMLRIWLPVCYDAVELTGRKRPENAWLERDDIWPWVQTLIAGALVFGAGIGTGMAAGWVPASPSAWLPLSTSMTLLGYFMVAVTIIVVAIPEGLPMSVTLSLAYSMRKMTAENNLVRRMHACETIGAATVICSDKTGTLTMNEMRVSSLDFFGLPPSDVIPQETEWPRLAEAAAVNATANLGEDRNSRLRIPLGNPTEAALLLWLEGYGVDYQPIRNTFEMHGQLTFSTERKYMATIGISALDGKTTLYTKGAPEIILDHCVSRRFSDGKTVPLNGTGRENLLAALKNEQARGMRTLGFAYRTLENADANQEICSEDIQELVEKGALIWMGFFSIADPVRADVPDAIMACRDAGVSVKMVTGDNEATACEIAAQAGMLRRGDMSPGLVVTGDEFMAMDEATAERTAASIKIISRAKPLAKQRLVTLLQKKGEVVAVTGDGSNDAPALNHADVGLAMGVTGTAVAKEAADIILLDDSFTSIVRAVMWGRSLYANIQKFILFQLTINVTALGVALLGPFLGVQLPLTVTQMLWVNLIMDTFAALALASEPPDWRVMKKPPRNPGAFIVTPGMAKFIFTVGGIFLILFLILILGFGNGFPMDANTAEGRHNLSIFFSVFVFLQLWNLFNARMLGQTRSALAQLSDSKMFLLIALTICVGQILITQYGGEIFRTTPLSIREWLWIIAGTSPVLWIGEVFRWHQRMRQIK
ncbi:MAG: calcium-translocating P-type ATPase, PMCA-type, partial [Oxalobacter sp.]|nr:calcium-translocating P-type ATPase, PMCA-type [Oxalobacter sp.]